MPITVGLPEEGGPKSTGKPLNPSSVDELAERIDTQHSAMHRLIEKAKALNAKADSLGAPRPVTPEMFSAMRKKAGLPPVGQDPLNQEKQTHAFLAGRTEKAATDPVEPGEMTTGEKVAATTLGALSGLPIIGPVGTELGARLTPGETQLNLEGLREGVSSDYGQLGSGVIAPVLGATAALPLLAGGSGLTATQAIKAAVPGVLGAEGILATDTALRAGLEGGSPSDMLNTTMNTMVDPKTQALTLALGAAGGAAAKGRAQQPSLQEAVTEWRKPPPPPPAIETLAGGQEINPGVGGWQRFKEAGPPLGKAAFFAAKGHPFMAASEATRGLKSLFQSREKPLSLEQGSPEAYQQMLGGVPTAKPPVFEKPGIPNFMSDEAAYQQMTEGVPTAGKIQSVADIYAPKTLQELMAEAPTQVRNPIQSGPPTPEQQSAVFRTADQMMAELNAPKTLVDKPRNFEPLSAEEALKQYGTPEEINSRIESLLEREGRKPLPSVDAPEDLDYGPSPEGDVFSSAAEVGKPTSDLKSSAESPKAKAKAAMEAAAQLEQYKPVRPGWTQMGENMKVSDTQARQQLHIKLSSQGNRILEEKFNGDVGAMLKWVRESGVAKDAAGLQRLFGKGFTRDMAVELGFLKETKPATKPEPKKKPYSPYLDDE